jgi:transposase
MRLSKHDLFQMDDEWLKKLPAELLLEVSKRLLHDVKELQDRLNRNPTNSSCPPTSQAPWEKAGDAAKDKETPAESGTADATATDTVGDLPKETAGTSPAVANGPSPGKGSGKSPGRQPGSPGHGRTQKLAVTATCEHRPESCTACGLALAADAGSQAYTAWDEIDIAPQVEGLIGLTFQCHASPFA